VIESQQADKVAIFTKMHHSTIDGISGANMMAYLFDLEPEPAVPPRDPRWGRSRAHAGQCRVDRARRSRGTQSPL